MALARLGHCDLGEKISKERKRERERQERANTDVKEGGGREEQTRMPRERESNYEPRKT